MGDDTSLERMYESTGTDRHIDWYRTLVDKPDKVPPFGDKEFIRRHGPITPEQGLAYKAHMCCD